MKKGYTLIESIIVIVVLSAAVFAIGTFLFKLTDSWATVRNKNNIASASRLAMNRMVREIRRVNKPSQIITFTATEFRFVDVGSGTVRFYQSGTDLYRDSDILASNLNSSDGLSFTYLDQNGAVTATKQDIKTIRISLHLEYGDDDYYLQSSARIRNLD
ncbi:MAG: type II secretion system GspH family protein [Candidatus Margulisbacteria bacterium]|nr:type II secretion system GspH family protein [Candidatus Margulisiibacteriota bacterium]